MKNAIMKKKGSIITFQVDGQVLSGESVDSPNSEAAASIENKDKPKILRLIHTQRIPANSKVNYSKSSCSREYLDINFVYFLGYTVG